MPRVCVGALVVTGGDEPRLLLGKRAAGRAYYPGVWDVPGGHREPGETDEQTLVRELEEELGVTPTAWWPLAELREEGAADGDALVLRVYAVTAWAGTPRNRLPDEHDAIGWFTLAEARALDLAHPALPALLRRAVACP